MRFPEESTPDIMNRLRRLEGQVRGIQRLVDEGAECKAVMTQLAAVRAAIDRVGFKLIAAGLREAESDAELDTLEEMFLKLS